MPLKYYNQPPYYDDFDQTKNYVRVLFRPGYAVQARELTQLQTAIQAQIERVGNHLFKEGTTVLGGQTLLDTSYAYVKLEETFQYPDSSGGTVYYPEGDGGTNLAYYTTAVGQTLTGLTSGVTATAVELIASDATDPLTLYVNYTAAGTDNTTHFFEPGEVLQYTDADSVVRYFKVLPIGDSPVGYGSRVSVSEGVYYVSGNFVYAPAESIVISKYTSTPSTRVVYKITESIITTTEDATLADNSLGTPNSSAPGANRYQISLDLITQSLADEERTEDDIIQLLIVKGGLVTARARTEYSELAKTLATRTYEESGNYTVNPFRLNIREYLRTETTSGTLTSNGGVYTAAQIMAAQDLSEVNAITYGEARLAVGLEPAVAYVNGFRIQTLDTSYVAVEKARDTAYINSAAIYCPLGGYVYVDTLVGLPDITNYGQVTLKGGTGLATVGYARPRSLIREGSVYRLYLFDVQMNSGKTFAEVTQVADSSNNFTASVVIDVNIGYAQLLETSTSSLLYKLPVNAASTLREIGNTVGFTYGVRRKYSATIATSQATITVSSGETFDSSTYADYVCVLQNSPYSVVPVTGISGVGTNTVTLSFGTSSGAIYVIAPTTRVVQEKSKTLQSNASKVITNPTTTIGGYDSLGKTDILRIRNIYMSANLSTAATTSDVDVTDRYALDNGQRENFYDIGRIQLKAGSSVPTGQLLVKFDYFTHGSGDYFSVDSYVLGAGLTLDDIPSFNSIKGTLYLGDVIDFRPTKGESGTFASGDTNEDVTNTIIPGYVVRTDITHYLPRIDKVYVNKNGQFGVQKGISSLNPKPPADPADSMVLYVLSLNAYTFDTTDLSATMIDNRRYTMRDIGRLEKRLANVEYYTSLSLLEKDTAQKQILDSSSQLRYKNGFVVDPFHNHNIGAVNHPDYHCSMEFEKGICRPEFVQDYVNLIWNSTTSSGVKKTGPLVTLDFNEVTMIDQPYASDAEYVNPHATFGWRGQIHLSPPGDDWKETINAPAISAAAGTGPGARYGWVSQPLGGMVFGAVWNSWQTTWFGSDEEEGGGHYGQTLQIPGAPYGWVKWEPINSNPSTATTTVVDDTIIDNSVIPYIRSRKIYFRGTGLKPNSRVHAYFDGINVDNYVRPLASGESFVEYSSSPDNTSYLDTFEHPDGADVLITNADGVIEGTFVIPHNSAIKFATGTRTFRLIDNTLNSTDSAYTYAEVQYHAVGHVETHNIVATQPAQITPKPAPITTPYVPPATRPSISIGVEGQTPRYAGIPFNLIAQASGAGITGITVYERSGAVTASSGSWVQIGSQTYSGVSAATFTARMYNSALPGYYEFKAVVTTSGGGSYESGYASRYFAPLPAELVGVPNDGSSTFYV